MPDVRAIRAAPLARQAAKQARILRKQVLCARADRLATRARSLSELLTSALDTNLTQVSIRQNEDMRRISAWAAISVVPTMVGGVYGMNFQHMPELQWRLGYPIALGVIALLCVGLYVGFRRSG